MATSYIIFAAISSLVFSAEAQLYADPGAEPWAEIVQVACTGKFIDLQQTINEVTKCLQKMSPSPGDVAPGGPSLPFCTKREEYRDCNKPYYEKIKECFDSKEAKAHMDVAFKLQQQDIDYVCKDNQKVFRDLMTDFDPLCPAKLGSEEAVKCKHAATSPDVEELFNDNNCKVMKKLQNCRLDAVKSCKTMSMYNYLHGQYNAMIGDDCPPEMANGASAAVYTVLLLVLPLFAFIF